MSENLEIIEKDILKKYELFLSDEKRIKEINKNLEKKEEFIEKFSKKEFSIKENEGLNLENYCIGKGDEDNFCYWVERKLNSLGSIRGGNASKFGVYFSKKSNDYKTISKFNNNKENALKEIKKAILLLIEAKNLDELEELEKGGKLDSLSHMFKYKIFYLYHPDEIIPIYSEDKLFNIFLDFGLKYDNYIDAQKKLLEIFRKEEKKEKNTLNFMYFIFSRYLLENIIKNINESDIIISDEQLYNILVSLTVNNFLIFAGPSGVGKTMIVKEIADSLGGKFEKLAIKANFTSEDNILGYYNPLLSKYEGTEILKFLIKAYKADNEDLYFLLLDEMNLSKIENYFSSFLSEIDKIKNIKNIDELEDKDKARILLFETNITNKKQYENIKYFINEYIGDNYNQGDFIEFEEDNFFEFYEENKNFKEDLLEEGENNINFKSGYIKSVKFYLPLKQNLKIIGTINEDETTKSISTKVLDRAQLIHFEVLDLFGENNEKLELEGLKNNFYDLLESKNENNFIEKKEKLEKKLGENLFGKFHEIIKDLKEIIEEINPYEAIGYRAFEEIIDYIDNYLGLNNRKLENEELNKNFYQALDNQILQKILIKLKSFNLNEQQIESFKEIEDLFYEENKDKNNKEKILYPKSLKFYKFLKSQIDD